MVRIVPLACIVSLVAVMVFGAFEIRMAAASVVLVGIVPAWRWAQGLWRISLRRERISVLHRALQQLEVAEEDQ